MEEDRGGCGGGFLGFGNQWIWIIIIVIVILCCCNNGFGGGFGC